VKLLLPVSHAARTHAILSAMKPYRPTLADLPNGGVEQSFDANVVHVDDELVAFGELLPDPTRGLPYGTPIHSLLVHLGDDGPEMVEFNDQENTIEVDAVERVELAPKHVRLHFRRGAGVVAGRVTLAPEIEVFEDVPMKRRRDGGLQLGVVELGALLVRFDIDAQHFEAVQSKLVRMTRPTDAPARTDGG
jgi:hypothetical protein